MAIYTSKQLIKEIQNHGDGYPFEPSYVILYQDHVCSCGHYMSYINWVQNGKVCIRCGLITTEQTHRDQQGSTNKDSKQLL